MNRRDLLGSAAAVVAGGLAGCTSQSSADEPDDATPTATPTDATATPADPSPTPENATAADTAAEDTTPTATPEQFPDSCPEAPDIEGLPSLPASQTEDSIREFAVAFERVYAVATTDRYAAIDDIQVNRIDSLDGQFQVKLAVEAELPTSTPGPDGETPTPMPADANVHRVLYRIQGEQVVRELRGFAADRKIDSECWTLESGE